jgi:hypothetical protein
MCAHSLFDPLPSYIHKRIFVIAIVLLFAHLVLGDCECGYSTTTNGTTYVFTEVLESDFLHLRDIAANTDWQRQNYSVTAQVSRGTHGTAFSIDDVVANPLPNATVFAGPGIHGGDPGLHLVVGGGVPSDGFVPTAQMDSRRQDMLWGSYRTSLKLPSEKGTCAAFFWVRWRLPGEFHPIFVRLCSCPFRAALRYRHT